MAISTTTFKNQYTANGVNTVFAYTFKIFDQSEIAVLLDDTVETITTDYSVSGVGNDNGGNVTFVTAPANGVIVTLKQNPDFTQDIEYVEGDDFPANAHEEGLDRGVLRDQFLLEQIQRAVLLPASSSLTSVTLPDPEDGKLIGWDGVAGAMQNISGTDIDITLASAFGLSLVTTSSASGGRSILGAERRATDLTAITTLQDTDQFIVADASDSNLSRKITKANLATQLGVISNVVVQKFTSSGTYTPTSGMKYCIVEVWGAGGGGGGVGTTTNASGGGGGAGGYAQSRITAATIGASQVVTIGAGGTAGANTGGNGGTGGTSSLGALVVATGGNGGNGQNSTSPITPGSGGSGTTGDITVAGQPGHMGWGGSTGWSGAGGSALGGGGASIPVGNNAAGNNGNAGGGGASGGFNSASTGRAGGVGGAGYIIITEFI